MNDEFRVSKLRNLLTFETTRRLRDKFQRRSADEREALTWRQAKLITRGVW